MAIRSTIFAGGTTGGRPGSRSINSILSDYKAMVAAINANVASIMQEAADLTLEKIIPYVPVQYGGLLESGRADVQEGPKGIAAVVSFGGEDAPVTPTPNAPSGVVDYAVLVNEDMERSSSPKFMERGTADAIPEVNALIVRRLKEQKL